VSSSSVLVSLRNQGVLNGRVGCTDRNLTEIRYWDSLQIVWSLNMRAPDGRYDTALRIT